MRQLTFGRGPEVITAHTEAEGQRRERDHWENNLHDLLEPLRIVRDAHRDNPAQFRQELVRALDSAFNPFPKGPDGKKHFNGKALVYWTGLGLLIGGTVSACNRFLNPQPDGTLGPDGNSQPTPESLCNSLLRIAAANSVDVAVTVPVWQAAAASSGRTQLDEQLACYMPATTPKSVLVAGEVIPVGPEPGNEVVQLAWAGGGEVIPILAVPGAQVDDFQLVQFLDPWSDQWEALGSDQARTSLAAVNINAATGKIEADDNGAVVTATRDSNGDISFQITTPDGKAVVLSQEQVKHNAALERWLRQAADIFEAEMPEIPEIPDIGLVGVATATPPTSEVGQPTIWQPPSLEQARVGVGGPFPADYGEVVERMTDIVLEQVPGAAEAGAVWNNGLGDNFHSIFWARAGNGNYLWKEGETQAFDEYPMRWNEYQSGIVAGQEFSEVPDSKDAVVGFTGPSAGGLGEKPVLMKEPVILADGSQEFLRYFDFQTGEWRLNVSILQAMVPDGYTVSQDQSGNWIASGDSQATLQFDLDKKVWVEVVPPLPPPPSEFLAQIPADKQYEIINGQVIVDGQVWFAINDSGEWEKIQRTITFDLEGGGTMEMFQFDTLEETLEYIVITDGATWLDTFDPRWMEKTPEDIAFLVRISTIPRSEFIMAIGLRESSPSKSVLWIGIFSMGDGTIIFYRGDEGMLEAIMLNEDAVIVSERVKKGEYLLPPRPQP